VRGAVAGSGASANLEESMRRSNFALRLQSSLMEEARKLAESEGVALNQLINVAVAEKISTLRTEQYFRERASRANRAETLRILARAGNKNPPLEGDELPTDTKNGRNVPSRKSARLPAEIKKRSRSKRKLGHM
jgi:hypothetical protein